MIWITGPFLRMKKSNIWKSFRKNWNLSGYLPCGIKKWIDRKTWMEIIETFNLFLYSFMVLFLLFRLTSREKFVSTARQRIDFHLLIGSFMVVPNWGLSQSWLWSLMESFVILPSLGWLWSYNLFWFNVLGFVRSFGEKAISCLDSFHLAK